MNHERSKKSGETVDLIELPNVWYRLIPRISILNPHIFIVPSFQEFLCPQTYKTRNMQRRTAGGYNELTANALLKKEDQVRGR